MSEMKKLLAVAVAAWLCSLGVFAQARQSPRHAAAGVAQPFRAANAAPDPNVATQTVKQYCAGCHNDRTKAGDLSLADFDVAHAAEHLQIAEKMIRKLRVGMMPPAGARRPDEATLLNLRGALETQMDEWAAANPHPGWRPFQRLTRAEYARAVKDLLDVDVDVTAFLPPDTMSQGFDNIADAQSFSPALPQGYLRAASEISRLAVGDRTAAPTTATRRVLATENQLQYVEGAPFGSRGGTAFVHTFPADGPYKFVATLVRTVSGELFGNTAIYMAGRNELLDISIDGERAAILEVDYGMSDAGEKGLTLETPPIAIKAGPHRIAAAFVPRSVAPVDDLLAPIEQTLIDTRIGTGFGVTTGPHLQELAIAGPMKVTGISETPSRRRIFSCRPLSANEEETCAAEIVKRLTAQAYRGGAAPDDIQDALEFFQKGRKAGDFENGIRLALQSILVSPRFLFRTEQAPAPSTLSTSSGQAGSGQARAVNAASTYRISDQDLASRLSFFLWASGPDADLVKAATSGALRTPAGFEKQVRRMLADKRSDALSTRFASQWLRLQDLDKIIPDYLLYPQYDDTLAQAMRKETELFFDSIVREDRSVLDLLTADYTFVNERLAKHYGIANVTGNQFRRVQTPAYRRGLLGQGSVLTSTSVADRTSPVLRGKWVMDVLLGTPPPPPPPDVPALDDSVKANEGGKMLSTRQRMEEHRKNPTCNACHRFIDPLGLALDNFDVTGAWRIKDNEVAVDSVGDLYDGTKMNGPAGLRDALLKHQDMVLRSFAENLLTYALGRRVEYSDMPTVRAIVVGAAKNDNRFSSYVLGVVNSAAFRMVKVNTPPRTLNADAPAR